MAFKAKYPWADPLLMGRESNPQARLDDYAGLVLERLNSGRERAALWLPLVYRKPCSTSTMRPST